MGVGVAVGVGAGVGVGVAVRVGVGGEWRACYVTSDGCDVRKGRELEKKLKGSDEDFVDMGRKNNM